MTQPLSTAEQTAADRPATPATPPAKRTRPTMGSGGAAFILYALPAPLLGKAFYELLLRGRFTGFVLSLALFALFILGAELARRGIARTRDFQARKVALAGGPPLKSMGTIVIALATFLTAFMAADQSLPAAIAIALGAALGMFLTYGLDARGAKGVSADAGISAAEVHGALDEARARIGAIEAAAKRFAGEKAYEMRQKIRDVVAAAGKVLHLIEEDPRDLRRARKFLNVYLDSAKTVTENYASVSAKAHAPEMEAKFAAVLDDLKKTCEEQYAKLLENDTLDLDAQIEVLKVRLTKEGLS